MQSVENAECGKRGVWKVLFDSLVQFSLVQLLYFNNTTIVTIVTQYNPSVPNLKHSKGKMASYRITT